MNSWQMAYGDVIMGMFDIVMAMRANTLDDASSGAAIVELKTNFLKTATGRLSPRGLARATSTFELRYDRNEHN